jgi:hypothetical protein
LANFDLVFARNRGISAALRAVRKGGLLLFFAVSSVSLGQIVQNGSFENGYTGWTAAGHQAIATNDPNHPASDGVSVVVFNINDQFANATLSQTFATTPGQRYRLSIDAGTVGAIADQRLEVRLTGSSVIYDQILTVAGPTAAAFYVPQNISFVANSSTTTLLFQDASITYFLVDLLIDNVQVTPENAQLPLVTTQPQRFATAVGRSATFSVTASDPTGQGLTYQWRFAGAPISGATNSSYTIPSVSNSDDGNYDVVITNSAGSVTSSAATLTVVPNGILLNGSFEYGSACWTFSGTNVSISTNDNYGVTDGIELVHFNFGQTPPGGSITQSFATTNQQTYVLAFDVAAFSNSNTNEQRMLVTVTGNNNTTLLSQQISVFAPGNGSRYVPQSFTFVGDGSNVTLTFKDVSLVTDSIDLLLDNVRVSLQNAPAITSQPQSAAVETGDPVTFSVTATGQQPLSYQWRFGGNPIPNATSSTYTINSTQSSDAGNYDVVVSNAVSSVTSSTAVLTVLPPSLLTNGSFEFGYTGWTESGNQQVVNNSALATDGTNAVRFNAGNSTPNGVLSQTISTTVGQRYLLSFDIGTNAFQSTAAQSLQVTVQGNTTLLSQIASITAQGSGTWYTTQSFTFVANSSSTVLTFQDVSQATNNIDLLLDNVRLVATTASILTNGGFESDFSGWGATGNQQIVSSPNYQVTEGTKAVVFNAAQSTPNAVLTQTFPTTPGQGYNLTFDMGATGFQTTAEQRLQVTVQGASTLLNQTASVFGQGSGTWYSSKVFSFIADSSTATLTFQDVSPTTNNIDGLLDNVQVNTNAQQGPVISQQPQSVTTQAGTQASFSVTASGTGTLTYQWRFNTNPISGANSNTYTINSVQNSDQGNYDVVVTDNNGSMTSATAVLTVAAAGVLLNGSFENNFSGWTASGNQLIATSPPYTVTDGTKAVVFNSGQSTPNAQLTQTFSTQSGQGYKLTFDLGVSAWQSSATQQMQVLVQGTTQRLLQTATVTAQGTGIWYTAESFTFTADSSSTTLSFTDTSSSTTNIDMVLDNVRITTVNGPVISSQPQDQTVQAGNQASFSVTASGTGTLTYQWRHGGNNISGANSSTYTIASTQSTDAGTYDVIVTDNTGPTTSGAATLTVVPAGIIANGSFEYGFFGWTASGAVIVAAPSQTTDGIYVAAFNTGQQTPNGILSQTFSTTPGTTYQIQFDLGVNSWQNTSQQTVQVDVVGTGNLFSQTYSIAGAGTGITYSGKSFTFTANSSQTILTFTDKSVATVNIDMLIDNVRASTVP